MMRADASTELARQEEVSEHHEVVRNDDTSLEASA